jgi:hypothetical protein
MNKATLSHLQVASSEIRFVEIEIGNLDWNSGIGLTPCVDASGTVGWGCQVLPKDWRPGDSLPPPSAEEHAEGFWPRQEKEVVVYPYVLNMHNFLSRVQVASGEIRFVEIEIDYREEHRARYPTRLINSTV